MAPARAVGIPRGWLPALAALVALLLGATWVMVAAHIAAAVGRCLAAEGGPAPAWAEDKCRHLMTYPPAVAAVSLAVTLVLCVREARAESKVRKVGCCSCSVPGGFARRPPPSPSPLSLEIPSTLSAWISLTLPREF